MCSCSFMCRELFPAQLAYIVFPYLARCQCDCRIISIKRSRAPTSPFPQLRNAATDEMNLKKCGGVADVAEKKWGIYVLIFKFVN